MMPSFSNPACTSCDARCNREAASTVPYTANVVVHVKPNCRLMILRRALNGHPWLSKNAESEPRVNIPLVPNRNNASILHCLDARADVFTIALYGTAPRPLPTKSCMYNLFSNAT